MRNGRWLMIEQGVRRWRKVSSTLTTALVELGDLVGAEIYLLESGERTSVV